MMKIHNLLKKFLFISVIISIIYSCKQPSNNNSMQSIYYEDILKEEVLNEQIINENRYIEELLNEELINEFVIFEEYIEQLIINEDMIIEDFILEYALVEDIQNEKLLSQVVIPDIDWKTIATKYTLGTSVIVFTAVLSITAVNTPIGCVFLKAFEGSLKGALSGATIGAAIGSGISTLKNTGNVDYLKKYSLENASDGYMWGAILGAVTGGLNGYKEFKNTPTIKTINSELVGKINPDTGIPYVERYVKTPNGWAKGVFPNFNSVAQVKLPKRIVNATKGKTSRQMKEATKILKKQVLKNKKLSSIFSEEQLAAILSEEAKIPNYTWHHSEKFGVMQLVDNTIHAASRHRGGFSIWGK